MNQRMLKPKALLIDMDDTIIAYEHGIDIDACWRSVCGEQLALEEARLDEAVALIRRRASWYWSDPVRHRTGRMDLDAARADIVAGALAPLGGVSRAVAERIGAAYGSVREEAVAVFPGALDALRHFRALGLRLALVTNGSSRAQRAKIERFALAPHFDEVLVEEEVGIGKPEPGAYWHAMRLLGAGPEETWMIGDNFEWEIAAPARLGIQGVWVNPAGKPAPDPAVPHRSIASLRDMIGVLSDVFPD